MKLYLISRNLLKESRNLYHRMVKGKSSSKAQIEVRMDYLEYFSYFIPAALLMIGPW